MAQLKSFYHSQMWICWSTIKLTLGLQQSEGMQAMEEREEDRKKERKAVWPTN